METNFIFFQDSLVYDSKNHFICIPPFSKFDFRGEKGKFKFEMEISNE